MPSPKHSELNLKQKSRTELDIINGNVTFEVFNWPKVEWISVVVSAHATPVLLLDPIMFVGECESD